MEQLSPTHANEREDRDAKNDDAHAADPMGYTAPQQNRAWQFLDHREDGRAGRGETRDRFKQSAGEVRRDSREDEWEATNGHQAHPPQTHNNAK